MSLNYISATAPATTEQECKLSIEPLDARSPHLYEPHLPSPQLIYQIGNEAFLEFLDVLIMPALPNENRTLMCNAVLGNL